VTREFCGFQTADPVQIKYKQVKLLAFAYFYLSESGLFNGLRRIQVRKIGSRPRLSAERLKLASTSLSSCPTHGGWLPSAHQKLYSINFRIWQGIVALAVLPGLANSVSRRGAFFTTGNLWLA
jgi:hypothetical protein